MPNPVRFQSALRKLHKLGVEALKPQPPPKGGYRKSWTPPPVSKRQANVLRKECPDLWDPAWDVALKPSQLHFRTRAPKLSQSMRNREQRAQKIEETMVGMDDRMVEAWKEASQKRRKEIDTESVYKRLMKVKR